LEACAVLVLRQASHIDHGTHRMIIGDVVSVRLAEKASTLAFIDGRYIPFADMPAA
jgi:flavin reductase (DIM6/NTAB) family NADH-FMN oxidoreductase RutF